MSDAQKTEPSTNNDAPPPPPPHRLAASTERKPSGVGCGVCAILAGFAVIAIALWVGAPPRQSPRERLPDYTVLYLETIDLHRLNKALDGYEKWSGGSGAESGSTLTRPARELVGAYLGSLSQLTGQEGWRPRLAAFALVPTLEKDLAAAVFLDAGSERVAKQLIEDRASPGALPRAGVETAPTGRTGPDSEGRYIFTLGRYVVATQSKDLEAYLHTPPKSSGGTLAGICPPPTPDTLLTILLRPFEYERLRRRDAPALPEIVRSPQEGPSKALVAIDVASGMEAGLNIRVHDLTSRKGAPRSRGWIGFAGTLLLWGLALVIGGILLLVVITLLLAAYFYLEQWWHGQLSPPTPPHTPEPSAGLKEDLARNPTDFTKASAGSEKDEDADEMPATDTPKPKKKSTRKKKPKTEDDAL